MAREWDIKRTTFSVGDFIGWNRQKTLELSPSFQRRSVWTKPQKSYLVDTVFRGLPIPIVFLREKTDVETLQTIREVVDGQQRLRTLISYADIKNLVDAEPRDEFTVLEKHNRILKSKEFLQLHEDYRRRILSYQFSVHVLPSDTSDADVLKIFARMNSTGTKLNDQELRNAEFFGEFKNLVYEISGTQLERWRKWKVLSEQEIARMKDAEMTSQLFKLIDEGLFEKTQPAINATYRKYEETFKCSSRVAKEFREIMDEIDEKFGSDIATSNYSNSAQFFQLFNLVMTLRREKVLISRKLVKRVESLGDRIRERDDLPEKVEVALQARFNRLSNQETVAEFLYQNVTK